MGKLDKIYKASSSLRHLLNIFPTNMGALAVKSDLARSAWRSRSLCLT